MAIRIDIQRGDEITVEGDFRRSFCIGDEEEGGYVFLSCGTVLRFWLETEEWDEEDEDGDDVYYECEHWIADIKVQGHSYVTITKAKREPDAKVSDVIVVDGLPLKWIVMCDNDPDDDDVVVVFP